MRSAPERSATVPFTFERRAAARGVAWGGIESATSALVGLCLTPLVVRTCGLSGLGLWAASWSLAHTTNLLDLGVGASYTRFSSHAIERSDVSGLNRILGAGTGFHLALGALVAAVAVILGPVTLGIVSGPGADAAQVHVVFACTLSTVLLRTLLSAYRAVVAGAQRIDLLGRIGAATALLEGCGAAAALLLGYGLAGMAVNSLFWGAVASLAEACAAHRLIPGLRPRPFVSGREEWRELLSYGLRLQVVRASEILSSHAPRLALAAGAGLASAGLYDLGARVAGALQVAALPLPVIQPLAGRLSARGDESRLGALARKGTLYVALIALPLAGMVLLDARALLKAWTGQDVPDGAATTARLLVLALACGFVVSPLRLVLRGCGRPGPEALAALCGALITVLLASTLAAPHGAPGVAGAVLAGTLVSACILGIAARGLSARVARCLPPALLAAGAGTLAGAFARVAMSVLGSECCATRPEAFLRLLPEGILLCGIALLVAALTGAVGREEALALASVFRRSGHQEGAGSALPDIRRRT